MKYFPDTSKKNIRLFMIEQPRQAASSTVFSEAPASHLTFLPPGSPQTRGVGVLLLRLPSSSQGLSHTLNANPPSWCPAR